MLLASLCACGPSISPIDPALLDPTAKILNRGNGPEPESLDPQKARQDSSLNILRDLFEGLTSLDRDGSVMGGAASTWDISADGRVYTFHLRDALRWSDGSPLTARDFAFGLQRLVDPKVASEYALIAAPIHNARAIVRGKLAPTTLGVATPDDQTVVVTLDSPTPYLPALLAHPSTFPVERYALEQYDQTFTRPGRLVSNGAFVLSEWVEGSHITVQRNRFYWNAQTVKLDAVRYYHMSDAGTELRRFRAGELQYTYVIPSQQFAWVRKHLPNAVHIDPQLAVYYYGFNVTRAPFKDNAKLRRALSMVIDRTRITQQVTGLGELPACSWIPPGVADYTPQQPDYCNRPMRERIEEARQLYAEAGYDSTRPLTVELSYSVGEMHNKIAIAVANMWQEALGVATKLHAEEFSTLMQHVRGKETEMFRHTWVGDYNDAQTFADLLRSDFGINVTGYVNSAYDKLLADAEMQSDAHARRLALQQAERVMLADQPLIPLYFYVSKHLVAPNVHGFKNNVMNVQYSKDLELAEATAMSGK
jgi:ABC-type oligopeptide transport system substrate-binding subunit